MNPRSPTDKRQRHRRWEDDWRNRLGLTWERIAYVLLGVVITMGADYLFHRDTVIRESMSRTEVQNAIREHDHLIMERMDQMENNNNQQLGLLREEIKDLRESNNRLARKKVPEIVYRIYRPKKPGEP